MSMSRGDFPFCCMNQHLKLQQTNGKRGRRWQRRRVEQTMLCKDRNVLLQEEKEGGPCVRYNHVSYRIEWEENCEKEKKDVERKHRYVFHRAYASAMLALSGVQQSTWAEGFEKDSEIWKLCVTSQRPWGKAVWRWVCGVLIQIKPLKGFQVCMCWLWTERWNY